MKEISRKVFIRTILSLAGAFFVYLFWKLLSFGKMIKEANKEAIEIKNDIPDGISFIGDFIVVKSDSDIAVLSNKCTHMNCKINQVAGNELVCPCHGSRFSAGGKVLSRPAVENLKRIKFEIDRTRNVIVIEHDNNS